MVRKNEKAVIKSAIKFTIVLFDRASHKPLLRQGGHCLHLRDHLARLMDNLKLPHQPVQKKDLHHRQQIIIHHHRH
jgi:hypothetical protein